MQLFLIQTKINTFRESSSNTNYTMESSNPNSSIHNFEKTVDLIIRLVVLFLLLAWCFDILKPFLLIIIWGAVIAIAAFPLYKSLVKIVGKRKKIAAFILVVLLLSVLIVPSVLVTKSFYDGISHLRETYKEGQPLIPPPGPNTANWPALAKPILTIWNNASGNFQATILKYSNQFEVAGKWVLSLLAGIGKGVIQFIVSIIVAGIMLVYFESLATFSKKLFQKLAGKNGEYFANVTAVTIRNVFKGVMVVAFVQSAMAGIGFFTAGVPFAGLWSVACLVFAITQIGIWPVVIPVVVYMFSVTDTVTATLLAVWLGLATISDNILKPILLGRNAPAPMLVILLGSIGGFIYNGFLGLFLGAVVLTIGYKIIIDWINVETKH